MTIHQKSESKEPGRIIKCNTSLHPTSAPAGDLFVPVARSATGMRKIKMKTLSKLLLIVMSFNLYGCATFLTLKCEEWMYAEDIPPVAPPYSGVLGDASLIAFPFTLSSNNEPGTPPAIGIKILLFPFCILDLPLSLVADTIILPYTIPRYCSYKSKIKNNVQNKNRRY
jgi:uncharacterized protein YceK